MHFTALFFAFCLSCATPSIRPQSAGETSARTVDVRDLCVRYAADRDTLSRFHDLPATAARSTAFEGLHAETERALAALDFDALNVEARVDAVCLRMRVASDRRKLAFEVSRVHECASLLPFGDAVVALHAALRAQSASDPEKAAGVLDRLKHDVDAARTAAEKRSEPIAQVVARRAAKRVEALRDTEAAWFRFRADYDPTFTWWTKKPHEEVAKAFDEYARVLREKLGGDDKATRDAGTIFGDPIGREALLPDLEFALIPYSPEELIQIADREMQWCTERMLEASRALGTGDEWKLALERVKSDHVAPGEQPALVRALAQEAIAFLKERDLVTVPSIVENGWRMSMLSADEQRVSPFFLGGEEVQVAFPTDSMSYDEKRMSMRGNNKHFAHATVFHELVPGHGLQQYYESRWNTHRALFSTPFWTEGWALYWEMLLWDLDFHSTQEDRIGALFWRMHRCARIRFSLSFHLGLMTPAQCVDYLVDTVGHERKNAEAEVRRSFEGGYGPLYQCAYMIGGLQIRALHRDLVASGKMSNRVFHDTILEGNNIPIEMVRARLLGQKIAREFKATWRFYSL
ncbi:MAG: DUF885 family protein [Planctomycetota bacterium]|nr:DUF885 family protein [Planctomycetota bacterium]